MLDISKNLSSDIMPSDSEILKDLQKFAKVGWWQADFRNKMNYCSQFIVELLNLDSPHLSFQDFASLIHPNYREKVIEKFRSIKSNCNYDEVFPIQAKDKYIWIHCKLGKKEFDQDNCVIAYGYLQFMLEESLDKSDITNPIVELNNFKGRNISLTESLNSTFKTPNAEEILKSLLNNILQEYGADRVYIFEYDWKKQIQNCIYEITLHNVNKEIENLQQLSINDTPWWTQQLLNNFPIVINNLDDLPQDASEEKKILAEQDIQSLMVIPLNSEEGLWGYLGIDITEKERKWTKEDSNWLISLSRIVGLCLEIKQFSSIIQKERENLQNLHFNMPLGYMRMEICYDKDGNVEDSILTDINPVYEKFTKTKREQIIGKYSSELSSSFSKDLKYIEEIDGTNKVISFETPFKHVNTYFHVVLYSPNKGEIIALLLDMTKQIETNEALRKSEEQLRSIYQNIPIGIEVYDKDGYLKDLNDKEVELFGLDDKSEAIGLNFFENPNIPDYVKESLKKGKNIDYNFTYNFNNVRNTYYKTDCTGSLSLQNKISVAFNENGEIENYYLINVDNTPMINAYNKIKEFETLFNFIASFAQIGIFKWNPLTKTGFASNQWYINLNHEPELELKDIKFLYQTLHPEDYKKINDFLDDVVKGKTKSIQAEFRVQDGDSWHSVRSYIKVKEYDPDNNIIEIIGSNINIDELKQTEIELRKAKFKAEESDRLKSAFVANMSHEIRTPLNAIVGFSDLIVNTDDPAEKELYTNIIHENNELLLQLISDILDISRIEAGSVQITNGDIEANALCQEIVTTLSFKTQPEVKLLFEPHDENFVFVSDKIRVSQLITNFINNAIKFTSEGYIKLSYVILENEIEFFVEDTGIGIKEEECDIIFDRFSKLNKFAKGTGLGLSICKMIIQLLNGEIGVKSTYGKGSTFWFKLPIHKKKN